jgi:aspartyl-tRNA(Asn)/glutamyl-tRNA(Gln) amidotransferase subunit A
MVPTTIAEAATALRDGRLTSVELVDASLDAISRHQPQTNAFVTVHRDRARAEARGADLERASGRDRGPLHGIPVSIKDLIDEAGIVTTAGSYVLADRVAPADATIVSRLREAGAVIIGRTNLHEFALGTTSEDSAFGPVHHPRDASRSAGGSSGGSAAAVATGMGLASVGTDTGGSVRIPSAICGLVGLKPTFGEIPTAGVVPLSTTFDHAGPLARTVQDAAWMFHVLAGRAPVTVRAADAATVRLRPLGGYFVMPLDTTVRHAIDAATSRLSAAGMRVLPAVEIENTRGIGPAYTAVALPEAAAWHAPYLEPRADRYTKEVRARIEVGRTVLAVNYLEGLAACRRFQQTVDALLDDCDALLLPAVSITAPPLGGTDLTLDGQTVPIRSAMLKLTQLFNLTGHPAISIPVASDGFPVGLQLVGRRHETDQLLALAAAVESILN